MDGAIEMREYIKNTVETTGITAVYTVQRGHIERHRIDRLAAKFNT
jgi:hypothetical protein